VRIKLNPDGSLISSEILDQSRMNAGGQTYYKILAESALRAVKLCNPLKVRQLNMKNGKRCNSTLMLKKC